jgi:hypothetical protein
VPTRHYPVPTAVGLGGLAGFEQCRIGVKSWIDDTLRRARVLVRLFHRMTIFLLYVDPASPGKVDISGFAIFSYLFRIETKFVMVFLPHPLKGRAPMQ